MKNTTIDCSTGQVTETTETAPEPDLEAAWHVLRAERNARLAESDWTQANDSPADKYAWAEYRQHLRDLPANTTDPFAPVWPTPPA